MPASARGVCRRTRSETEKSDTPPDLRAAAIAAEQHGCISLSQLETCDIDSDGAAARVRGGRLHRVHQGVYAVGHYALTRDARFMAAVLAVGPTGVLSHRSAAALLELLEHDEQRLIELTVTGTACRRRPGLRIHRTRSLHEHDVERRYGIRVTSAARTLLDLADELPDKGLRRAVRQAQALRLTNVRQIAGVLGRANGRRGVARLAALVADGPAPTYSGHEDAVLELILGAGIAHPHVNERLLVGTRPYYPDMRWPAQRLILEVDSGWHDGRLALQDDAVRQADLEALGERVLRTTLEQAIARPRQLVARLVAAGAPYTDAQS